MEKSPIIRINWMHVLAYLFMEGGVAALTLFLAIEVPMYGAAGPTVPLLFAAVTSGMVAFTFYLRERGIGWLVLAGLPWSAAGALGLLWMSIEGWLHPALLLALMAFGVAGVVLHFASKRKDNIPRPMLAERTRFDPLGAHRASERELTPMERDHS